MASLTTAPYTDFSQFPSAAGYPARTGVEIPQIWSKQLAMRFYNDTVLSSISTGKYSGEIKGQGDNLIIRLTPRIQTRKYKMGQPIQYDQPQATTIVLPIDKANYWATQIDDVDKSMMDLDWTPKWHEGATKSMAESLDTEVLAWLPSAVSAYNCGHYAGKTSGSYNLGYANNGLAVAVGSTAADGVVNLLEMFAAVLAETNTPTEGRYVILPPQGVKLLKTGVLSNAQITGDTTSPLRNGIVGKVDHFTVLQSNLLPHATDNGHDCYDIPFGWSEAIAFAQTVTETETLRAQEFFGNKVRGLQVFGYQCVQPEQIGYGHVYWS